MPVLFHPVPNWTSTENQGDGVATADLNGDGKPEVLVLRVHQPTPGPNVAFYCVGQTLDTTGKVGAWGPWIPIPGWNSMENQGSALAVADLDGDGHMELIVFQVEHRVPGPNRALYRVGRKLDATGNVTGGWEPWQEVPDWQSFENQGAALAVAQLDGSGQRQMIVLRLDNFHEFNPTRANRAYYCLGQDLQPTGNVAGPWSDWIEIDWASWFNQGVGLAVADLDNNGRPELLVFQIDNPPGENAGLYRIGWNLDQSGKVQEGWGAWNVLEGWQSWEDQGGGIALADFGGGIPQLVVLHVDNPVGENSGLLGVLPVELDTAQAEKKGLWRLVPYPSPVLPVHAALLHTGKVLFFAGSGNNVNRAQSAQFGNEADGIYTSVVWDVVANTFDHPPTLRRPAPSNRPVDFFCCGHCFLPDGQLLVVGGTAKYDLETNNGFFGIPDTTVFNTTTEQWSFLEPMARGRWYPTATMLSDGRVVASSGRDDQGNGNDTLELNSAPGNAAWTKTRDFTLPSYPHLFLLEDGRFFFSGGKMDTDGDSVPLRFDPLTPSPSEVLGGLRAVGQRNQCASVLLPPAQAQKVMIVGGGPEGENEATDNVDIIDLNDPTPQYRPAARLNYDRMHVNAVILPDRSVIAVGGGGVREAGRQRNQVPQLIKQRLVTERFETMLGPTDQWELMAEAQIPRLYHSVALLLPDGRVVSAGGNPDKGSQVDWLPADPMEEMRLEIYSPPYLFKGPRPQITAVPEDWTYGGNVTINSPEATQIKWISLIRSGLTTHSFNGEQRLIDVPFAQVNGTTLQATLTNEPNLAPPGWYMLFLTDINGVPSVASWVHVS